MEVKSVKVNSMSEAWEKVNEIFPTDYELNNMLSERAGYNVYSSTAEGHYYDYICDLGSRLEINLNNGDTINVWVSDDTDTKSTETMKGEDTMKSTDTKSAETMSKREMKAIAIDAYKGYLHTVGQCNGANETTLYRYLRINGYADTRKVLQALTIRIASYGKFSDNVAAIENEKGVKVLSVSMFRKMIEQHEINSVLNARIIGKEYKVTEHNPHERRQRGVTVSVKLTDREIATIRAALEGMNEDVIKKALDKALVKKLEDKKARDAAKAAKA